MESFRTFIRSRKLPIAKLNKTYMVSFTTSIFVVMLYVGNLLSTDQFVVKTTPRLNSLQDFFEEPFLQTSPVIWNKYNLYRFLSGSPKTSLAYRVLERAESHNSSVEISVATSLPLMAKARKQKAVLLIEEVFVRYVFDLITCYGRPKMNKQVHTSQESFGHGIQSVPLSKYMDKRLRPVVEYKIQTALETGMLEAFIDKQLVELIREDYSWPENNETQNCLLKIAEKKDDICLAFSLTNFSSVLTLLSYCTSVSIFIILTEYFVNKYS